MKKNLHDFSNRKQKNRFICDICGKEFFSTGVAGAKNSPKRCSDKCKHEAVLKWRRRTLGKSLTENGEMKCKNCGKLFNFIHHGRHTCSDKCEDENRKKVARTSARKNPNKYNHQDGPIGALKVEDATFYQNYKLPVRKVADGFGYYGTLMYSKSLDRIQCHACGEWFRALSGGYKGHLTLHGLTKATYQEKYGLARSTKLICEGLREKMIKNYERRYEEMKGYEKNLDAFQKPEFKSHPNKKIRLETKNQRGTCPDQLLEKILVVAKENNGVASFEDFKRKYEGRYMETVRQTFGSWKAACKLANVFTGRERPKGTYSELELLSFLKNFYDENGRTPCNSDFKRGLLPGVHAYRSHFKTLNEARRRAGIPQLIMKGRGHWLESKELVKTLPSYFST